MLQVLFLSIFLSGQRAGWGQVLPQEPQEDHPPLTGQHWVLQDALEEEEPSQSRPLQERTGLLQDRLRLLVPPPHTLLHLPQPAQGLQPPSTGQQRLQLQLWFSTSFPGQLILHGVPPPEGRGLLQRRCLFWLPHLQEVLHVDHDCQAPQPPLTAQ